MPFKSGSLRGVIARDASNFNIPGLRSSKSGETLRKNNAEKRKAECDRKLSERMNAMVSPKPKKPTEGKDAAPSASIAHANSGASMIKSETKQPTTDAKLRSSTKNVMWPKAAASSIIKNQPDSHQARDPNFKRDVRRTSILGNTGVTAEHRARLGGKKATDSLGSKIAKVATGLKDYVTKVPLKVGERGHTKYSRPAGFMNTMRDAGNTGTKGSRHYRAKDSKATDGMTAFDCWSNLGRIARDWCPKEGMDDDMDAGGAGSNPASTMPSMDAVKKPKYRATVRAFAPNEKVDRRNKTVLDAGSGMGDPIVKAGGQKNAMRPNEAAMDEDRGPVKSIMVNGKKTEFHPPVAHVLATARGKNPSVGVNSMGQKTVVKRGLSPAPRAPRPPLKPSLDVRLSREERRNLSRKPVARDADLSAVSRNDLSKKTFGLPGQRKYPMPDAAHARSAKSYASKEEHSGKLSKGQEAQIDRKADKVLGKDAGGFNSRVKYHDNLMNHHAKMYKFVNSSDGSLYAHLADGHKSAALAHSEAKHAHMDKDPDRMAATKKADELTKRVHNSK